MERSIVKKLLLVTAAVLCITALILLYICIFTENEGSNTLAMALGCTALANFCNIFRMKLDRNGKNE